MCTVYLPLFEKDANRTLFEEREDPAVEAAPPTPEETTADADADKALRIATYRRKREDRIDRLRDRADKARAASQAAYVASNKAIEHIPFGQPILVGHHSERRHRADLARCHRLMDKSCEEQAKAVHYERAADAAESNRAISSEDPEATDKLAAKVAAAEKLQALMVAANKIVHRKPKNEKTDEKVAALVALGLNESQAAKLFVPDCLHRYGFPDYALTNNNANIRRMKERAKRVERAQEMPEVELEGDNARLEDCPPDNRVRLYFPGKPAAEVRGRLKRAGFRWAPSLGCWQAYRNYRTLEVARQEAGVKKGA